MNSRPKFLKILRMLFLIIGCFYLLLIGIQITNIFIYKTSLVENINLLSFLEKFLNKAALGLLCFIISTIFHLLMTRNVGSLLMTGRLLNACCVSFCLLGIVNIAAGIETFVHVYRQLPYQFYVIPVSIANIVLVKALPIISGVAMYVIFNALVEFIQFESEVA